MIFINNSEDYIRADSLGNYCIELDSTKIVYFSKPSYSLYKLNVSESYATIEMGKVVNTDWHNTNLKANAYELDRTSPITGFSPSFSISLLKTDYSEFETQLNSDVIKSLETPLALKFEVAGYIKRTYVGIGYGSYQRPNTEEDDLENVKSTTGHFSVNLGYNLINRKVILTPHIGYFSYRNRVKSKGSHSDLNDYLNNSGLDLKFVGYFAKAGIDLQYVISESFDHCFFGIRANYLHQIGDTVIKNNFGDKLSSDKNINFDHLNLEIIFTIFTN